MSVADASTKCHVPLSCAYEWLKNKQGIMLAWADKTMKKRSRADRNGIPKRQRGKFVLSEQMLHGIIMARRNRGRRVSPRWVSRRMVQLVVELYPDTHGNFKASPCWRQRFYSRWNLVTRKRTNKKALNINIRIEKWRQHHMKLRRFLQFGKQQSHTYGRFDLWNRYNLDQLPFKFQYNGTSTIETKGTKTVAIKTSSSCDGDKRFCSGQVLLRCVTGGPKAFRKQPPITVIFRGIGQVSAIEKRCYDSRVEVIYQPKAWADRPTTLEWVEKVLKKHLQQRAREEGEWPDTMLLCDNLDSQIHSGFLDALKKLSCTRFLLPGGETEMCQPIDAGIGAVLGMLLEREQDAWLDEEENLDAWEGDEEAKFKLDTSMRRILITKWLGNAYEELCTNPVYEATILRCFQITGGAITADGTDDHLICPMRGMKGYTIPPVVTLIDDANMTQCLSGILDDIVSLIEDANDEAILVAEVAEQQRDDEDELEDVVLDDIADQDFNPSNDTGNEKAPEENENEQEAEEGVHGTHITGSAKQLWDFMRSHEEQVSAKKKEKVAATAMRKAAANRNEAAMVEVVRKLVKDSHNARDWEKLSLPHIRSVYKAILSAGERTPALTRKQDMISAIGDKIARLKDPHPVPVTTTTTAPTEAALEEETVSDVDAEDDLDESWDMSLAAAQKLNPTLEPVPEDFDDFPKRFTGIFILILIKKEWEFAQVNLGGGTQFRIHLLDLDEWGFTPLHQASHGRHNAAEDRWVLLNATKSYLSVKQNSSSAARTNEAALSRPSTVKLYLYNWKDNSCAFDTLIGMFHWIYARRLSSPQRILFQKTFYELSNLFELQLSGAINPVAAKEAWLPIFFNKTTTGTIYSLNRTL